MPDYSVKAGRMTSQVAAALAAARNADRSQRGAPRPAAGDASVRFGQAHFAHTQEGFAKQFGPYAGKDHSVLACLALNILDMHGCPLQPCGHCCGDSHQ